MPGSVTQGERERERETVREQRCTSQSQVSCDVILSESCLGEQVVSKTSQPSLPLAPLKFSTPSSFSHSAPSFSDISLLSPCRFFFTVLFVVARSPLHQLQQVCSCCCQVHLSLLSHFSPHSAFFPALSASTFSPSRCLFLFSYI